ncbi:MAG TPA: potassium transporter, partial [Bacteroidales bacterium]|nr:potassium transporter [Bacteroidales bacterium]
MHISLYLRPEFRVSDMKMINPLIIVRILSTILLIESLAFLICLPVATIYKESFYPYLWSSVIAGLFYILFRFISRSTDTSKISNRDAYIAVILSWFILSATGMLPYLISGAIPSVNNAFFESASGFTTTGASILTDVEALPHSIIFWRSLTHWIGGIGIIVLVIIILPSLKLSSHQLFSLESSLREKILPKTKAVGFRLFFVYIGLTVLQIVFMCIGGMNLFDSICHTFGTVATGGFSTKNSGIGHYSSYIQYVIAIFMFLSGVSFVLYYYIVKRQFTKVKHNEELWFYTGTVIISGITAALILLIQAGKPVETAFREGFFQVISIITTTGYATSDYLLWPSSGIILIFILFFSGASTGSTTGGIKMARHLLIIKNIRNIFVKLIHPNAITQIKLNKKPVNDSTNISIISFIILYIFIFISGSVIIVSTGVEPVTSASAVAATLGN